MIKNLNFKRRISILLLIILLFQALVFNVASEETNNDDITTDVVVSEMVCRIKNAGSGLYLDSYKYTLKTKGKSYVENYSESSLGQVFHISPCEDGTYMIIPQNNDAEYAYSYLQDSTKDRKIKKVKVSSAGSLSKFDIVEYKDNKFVIAPANSSNQKGVLVQSDTISEYKDPYVEIQDFDPQNSKHLWIIEPIKTEKLSVIFTTTKVRLYSSGKFYARKYPYNVFTDDITWSSDNEAVLLIGADGEWCALSEGKAVVTASLAGMSESFTVTVVNKDAYTWYSQNNIYTSDWDATKLKYLYFRDPSTGTKKKFAIDSKETGGNNCWIDEGCGNCSVAMVLNNMGAVKTKGYDFRSGQEGNLIADPYTVALANSGAFGSENTTSTLSGNPIYMRWSYVAEQFNVNGKKVILNKVYSPSTSKIKTILSEHPEGVIVQLSTSKKNHYIVFTECINPTERSNSKLKFLVYDSAAYTPETGENVPFEKSTSYVYEGYRYSNIKSVMYFTLED